MKAAIFIIILIAVVSCSQSKYPATYEHANGISVKVDRSGDYLVVTTRIKTDDLNAKQRGAVTEQFTRIKPSAYLLTQMVDTNYMVDVHLERYYGALPHDIVSYYFSLENTVPDYLVIDEPMIAPEKLVFDL